MKKEYDFSKSKLRSERVKPDKFPAKFPTSIRLDGSVLSWFKTEAERLGVPYQTLISSVLHRYSHSELIDSKEIKKITVTKQQG